MPPREYDFAERMRFSDADRVQRQIKWLLGHLFTGAENVVRAHAADDRRGTDWWVEMSSGARVSVDVKVRGRDYWESDRKDDLALEIWSVVETQIIGWTRNWQKRTDYALWIWKDTGRFELVPFAPLCHAFNRHWRQWEHDFRCETQRTTDNDGSRDAYHSKCVLVPRETVRAAIGQISSGYVQINEGNSASPPSQRDERKMTTDEWFRSMKEEDRRNGEAAE